MDIMSDFRLRCQSLTPICSTSYNSSGQVVLQIILLCNRRSKQLLLQSCIIWYWPNSGDALQQTR